MPKLFDRIILDIIIILTTLMWTGYLIKNTAVVIVLTVAVYLLLKVFYLFLYVRYQNLKTMSSSELEFLLALKSPDEQAALLKKTLPDASVLFEENNYFGIKINGAETLFFCVYKFTPVTNDDVARAARIAAARGISEIYFIGKMPSRQTMLIAARIGLNARFLPVHKLKKYLVKHNALPEKIQKSIKKKRERHSFRAIIGLIFHPSRGKYFAITGFILAFMTIFTPLKLYYIVLSSIAFTIAAVSLVMKRFYE